MLDSQPPIDPVLKQFYISASFGVSLMITIFLFCRISGGLFNPAVSLAFALTGLLTPLKAVVLSVAQILGGIVASAVAQGLLPGRLDIGNDAKILSTGKALVLEAFMTLGLLLTIFMVNRPLAS